MSIYIETKIIGKCDYCGEKVFFRVTEINDTTWNIFKELTKDWLDYRDKIFCTYGCRESYIELL